MKYLGREHTVLDLITDVACTIAVLIVIFASNGAHAQRYGHTYDHDTGTHCELITGPNGFIWTRCY